LDYPEDGDSTERSATNYQPTSTQKNVIFSLKDLLQILHEDLNWTKSFKYTSRVHEQRIQQRRIYA